MDSVEKAACIIIGMIASFFVICSIESNKITKLRIKSVDKCVQTTGKILECKQLYR